MDLHSRSIKLDHRPLYDRAVEALRWFIDQSAFQPGDRLPGESELARQLGISRPTLREAMGALESQGVIFRRHGVGAFVTTPPRGAMYDGLERLESMVSMAAKAGVSAGRTGWEVTHAAAPEEAATALGVISGASLIRAQAIIAETGRSPANPAGSLAYLDSYVRPEYADFEELTAFAGGSLLDYLLQCSRVRLSYTKTRLHAVSADAHTAPRLGAALDRPLLLLVETLFSDHGAPVVWTRNFFVTEKVNFQIIRHIISRAMDRPQGS
ncbi:MAG: GntR family transcriptional regulator [Chloroflexi bacterium]|nr:GntR family transcriptional regulator [Chloroflexota bacterium]